MQKKKKNSRDILPVKVSENKFAAVNSKIS